MAESEHHDDDIPDSDLRATLLTLIFLVIPCACGMFYTAFCAIRYLVLTLMAAL